MSTAPHPPGRAVIVLAAGHGTRMGGPKAFTRYGDRTFLERILERCAESDADATIMVDPAFKTRLLALLKTRPVPRSHLHLRWVDADGHLPMLASVQTALRVGGFTGGFWLWPVDAPFLSTEGWRTLCQAVDSDDTRILKPQAGGRTGHPVWFPGWAVSRIVGGDWPNGLLGFLSTCQADQIRSLELPGERLNDVDTPEELAAMNLSPPPVM